MKNIICETEDNIAIVTLNDTATRNALSESLTQEFAATFSNIKKNNALKAVVLTGAGGHFSSGGHLAMLKKFAEMEKEECQKSLFNFYSTYLNALLEAPPVIAAVSGFAVGAGCCLAIACDLKIIHPQANLSFNFARIGITPGMGAAWSLRRHVADNLALELLLTGRNFSGEEAKQMDLANATSQDPLKAAKELSKKIGALPDFSVQAIKNSWYAQQTKNLTEELTHDAKIQAESLRKLGKDFFAAAELARKK